MMKKFNFIFLAFALCLFACAGEQNLDEASPAQPDAAPVPGDFTSDNAALHYYLFQLGEASASKESMTAFKDAIQTFNDSHFADAKLRISSIYLGDAEHKVPVIIIRRFTNFVSADAYHDALNQQFSSDIPITFQAPISQTNYRNVLRSKSMEGYVQFYQNQ